MISDNQGDDLISRQSKVIHSFYGFCYYYTKCYPTSVKHYINRHNMLMLSELGHFKVIMIRRYNRRAKQQKEPVISDPKMIDSLAFRNVIYKVI